MNYQVGYLIERILSVIIVILLTPVFLIIGLLIRIDSTGQVYVMQKRWGKSKKIFNIYKFRTMIKGADELQKTSKYQKLNEADGPVFKIRDDPRYTRFGRLLAHTGLDELPQLINIIKGEMAFVGPRPLPVDEAKRVPKKYEKRFSVLPGITSSWVVKGAHNLSFSRWMELDVEYVENKNFQADFNIGVSTVILMIKQLLRKLNLFNKQIN